MATQVREKSTRHDAFITEQLGRAQQRIRLIDLAAAGGVWFAATLAYLIALMLLDRAFALSQPTERDP